MIHAIYPGSFDPLHLGHLNIIERASTLSDTLTVAVMYNPLKDKRLFALEERLAMLQESCARLGNVKAKQFQGLLVDFAHQENANYIVKGLRNAQDFAYEAEMAQLNRRISTGVETMFLLSEPEYSFLSSTRIKELASLGVDIRDFVPTASAEALAAKV